MVRLEICRRGACYSNSYDLHSSMVRLEMFRVNKDRDYFTTFTFQYG